MSTLDDHIETLERLLVSADVIAEKWTENSERSAKANSAVVALKAAIDALVREKTGAVSPIIKRACELLDEFSCGNPHCDARCGDAEAFVQTHSTQEEIIARENAMFRRKTK